MCSLRVKEAAIFRILFFRGPRFGILYVTAILLPNTQKMTYMKILFKAMLCGGRGTVSVMSRDLGSLEQNK